MNFNGHQAEEVRQPQRIENTALISNGEDPNVSSDQLKDARNIVSPNLGGVELEEYTQCSQIELGRVPPYPLAKGMCCCSCRGPLPFASDSRIRRRALTAKTRNFSSM
jgi:hypothetical protein